MQSTTEALRTRRRQKFQGSTSNLRHQPPSSRGANCNDSVLCSVEGAARFGSDGTNSVVAVFVALQMIGAASDERSDVSKSDESAVRQFGLFGKLLFCPANFAQVKIAPRL